MAHLDSESSLLTSLISSNGRGPYQGKIVGCNFTAAFHCCMLLEWLHSHPEDVMFHVTGFFDSYTYSPELYECFH